jgi:3-phenylpropionate/cinnamic acid dioxygenase small subunit
MTETKLRDTLHADVVIVDQDGEQRTGAQLAAPGHKARAAYEAGRLPPRGVVPADNRGTATRQRVEEFLYHQAELLDRKQWAEYTALFDDAGLYWMPVTPEQTDWLDSPSIFVEDRHLMQVRCGRITHPNAWSQAAEWGTSHVIGNVVIEEHTAESIVVRSRFHMLELRRDNVRHFAGRYQHVLVPHDDDFRVRLQRVDLVNAQAPYEYVLQAWV